jgi:Helicase associated domain
LVDRQFARRLPVAPKSEVRQQQLDDLEFVWEVLGTAWEEGFRYLRMYKEREGHCRVPAKDIENGFGLGRWVDRQRQSKRNLSLSEERRQELDKIGFAWEPFEADWEEGFRFLAMYKEREGHCRVPQSHKENGFASDLGLIVNAATERRCLRCADNDSTSWVAALRQPDCPCLERCCKMTCVPQ